MYIYILAVSLKLICSCQSTSAEAVLFRDPIYYIYIERERKFTSTFGCYHGRVGTKKMLFKHYPFHEGGGRREREREREREKERERER